MKDLLRILLPPLLWLAGFSALYGLHGIGCAGGWAEGGTYLSPQRLALLSAWGAVIVAQGLGLLALRSSRFASPSPFVYRVSLISGWVGLFAAIWTLQPVATMSTCAF